MKTKLSRRSFFAFGAAASVPASAQESPDCPFKIKIPRPEKGSWDLNPSPSGWKLFPITGKQSVWNEDSRLILGSDSDPLSILGSVRLNPADPRKAAIEFVGMESLIEHISLVQHITDKVNQAIVQLAMEGHSLANVKISWTEDWKIRMEMTSTQPFGVGKAVAEMPQEGILG